MIDRTDDYKIYDVDGKEYIDMIIQFAVMNFGYNNAKIVDATVAQMRKSPLVNTGNMNPLYAKFANLITKATDDYSVRKLSDGHSWLLSRLWGGF